MNKREFFIMGKHRRLEAGNSIGIKTERLGFQILFNVKLPGFGLKLPNDISEN